MRYEGLIGETEQLLESMPNQVIKRAFSEIIAVSQLTSSRFFLIDGIP